MHTLLIGRTYKSFKKTVSNSKTLEDYASEEAWEVAAKNRNYLLEKIVKKCDCPNVARQMWSQVGKGRQLPQKTESAVQCEKMA